MKISEFIVQKLLSRPFFDDEIGQQENLPFLKAKSNNKSKTPSLYP